MIRILKFSRGVFNIYNSEKIYKFVINHYTIVSLIIYTVYAILFIAFGLFVIQSIYDLLLDYLGSNYISNDNLPPVNSKHHNSFKFMPKSPIQAYPIIEQGVKNVHESDIIRVKDLIPRRITLFYDKLTFYLDPSKYHYNRWMKGYDSMAYDQLYRHNFDPYYNSLMYYRHKYNIVMDISRFIPELHQLGIQYNTPKHVSIVPKLRIDYLIQILEELKQLKVAHPNTPYDISILLDKSVDPHELFKALMDYKREIFSNSVTEEYRASPKDLIRLNKSLKSRGLLVDQVPRLRTGIKRSDILDRANKEHFGIDMDDNMEIVD